MGFVLTEEQTLLRDSAREFLSEKAPISALRKLRDDNDEVGFSRELWAEMVELGWAGIVIPEEYGGLDFGFQGLSLVLEEAGKTLTASPLVSTVLVGAQLITLGGNEEQKQDILPKVASGECLLALALDEGPHFAPLKTEMPVEKRGDGFVLNGEKTFVLDGHVADRLIVVARTSGTPGEAEGLTLFVVDGDASGVARERLSMLDSRNAALVKFNNVEVPATSVLGSINSGFGLLEQVLDRAAIGLAAEMLGSQSAVFEMTLEYLKERRQFGQVIGSFQALQHRAAQMYSDIELAKSVVMQAATAVDEGSNELASLASLAKARVNDTFNLISREGIQMHGGIGMTDEHDIGLYLKRARVAEHTFGSSDYHRDRYARLNGY